MLSGSYTHDEVYAITDKVTPEMVRKTYHIGNPAESAAKIRPFTEAGATRYAFADVSALLGIRDAAEAAAALSRSRVWSNPTNRRRVRGSSERRFPRSDAMN
jgi:hypothetical protein